MHRIEVMCDYTITISGAVCANVRKKLSLSSSRSLFFHRTILSAVPLTM